MKKLLIFTLITLISACNTMKITNVVIGKSDDDFIIDDTVYNVFDISRFNKGIVLIRKKDMKMMILGQELSDKQKKDSIDPTATELPETPHVQKPVKNIFNGYKHYVDTDAKQAELTIIVEYEIPGIVRDADEFYFKAQQTNVIKHCDDSFEIDLRGGCFKAKCRDGINSWCNSCSCVNPKDDEIEIKLCISWGGNSSGYINKNLIVAWENLPKTIKDKSENITIKVKRKKELKTPGRILPINNRKNESLGDIREEDLGLKIE